MTRLSGLVADDDGAPLPGVYVTAELQGDRWLAGHAGQVDGFTDTYTGPDGRWTLALTPASELLQDGTWWLIRVWQRATFGVNVPDDPGRVVDVSEPGVLRDGGQPPPPIPGDFVPRAEVGVPGGIATLGEDGLLSADQRPPSSGGGGGAGSYEHRQEAPADVWVVPHGLGRRPVAWSLYDAQGRECGEYVVDHPDLNRAVVRMDVPTAGTLYLI